MQTSKRLYKSSLMVTIITIILTLTFLLFLSPKTTHAVIEVSGNIASNTTWTNVDVYHVIGHINILSGVTLTINPGVVVKFAQGYGIYIYGTLNAQGASGKIYFTTVRDDTAGGDTNGDGDATSPDTGWWRGIFMYSNGSATLNNVELRYYGNGGTPGIHKTNTGGLLNITNSTITDGFGFGIRIQNSTGAHNISGCTIKDNNQHGIYLQNTGSNLTIHSNTIQDNPWYGIFVEGTSQPDMSGGGHTFINNGYGEMGFTPESSHIAHNYDSFLDVIRVEGGNIYTSVVWQSTKPYYVKAHISIMSASTLTINPNVIVKFADGYRIYIYNGGTLNAQGTSGKIYFTTVRDDTVGGDTNGDGDATSPAKGWWSGFYLYDGGRATLDNVELRYYGYGNTPGIDKRGSTGLLNITNSTITDGFRHGIQIYYSTGAHVISGNTIMNNNYNGIYVIGTSATPTITKNDIHSNDVGILCEANGNPLIGGSLCNGNNIYNNSTYSVRNTTVGLTVNAQYNYWGSPTGPPTSGANMVSSDVDYSNYLTTPYVPDTADPATSAIPTGGAYSSSQNVTLTCNDGTCSGCDTTYYTTDGSNPTTGSTVYMAPINIATTTTLKFFSVDNEGNSESVNTESYTITSGGNTPDGPNATANFPNGASVRYNNVNSVCNTILIEVVNPTQGPPTNFQFIRDGYFDISTDCTGFNNIIVTLPYNESYTNGQENNLRLLHRNGVWEDCTYALDTTNNIITGRVTSLSPFGIGYSFGGVSSGANTNVLIAIALLAISTGIFLIRRLRSRTNI